MSEQRTHDFGPGRRRWGHDYTITRRGEGNRTIKASGWGHDGAPIQEGDYLLLQGGQRCTRYQVTSIRHLMDPPDMWHAELAFAPRTYATQAEKDAAR
ncbi:hypothetical protein ACFU67_13300 [Streptomyces rhizosphaericola]|uniref:hypothetical protein n=1 Tax=Streptomyces rhizosphaericola TaxID=2564098 RepID=UPI0036A32615